MSYIQGFNNGKSVEDNYTDFCEKIKTRLDQVAPMKDCKKSGRQSACWYNDHLKSLKLICWQAERKWRKLYLNEDKSLWKAVIVDYRKGIVLAKSEYFANIILNSKNNSRTIFKIVKDSTVPECTQSKIEPSQVLCNSLATFFLEKISNIINGLKMNDMSGKEVPNVKITAETNETREMDIVNGVNSDPLTSLEQFEPLSEEIFNRAALGVSSGSPLDPLPNKI